MGKRKKSSLHRKKKLKKIKNSSKKNKTSKAKREVLLTVGNALINFQKLINKNKQFIVTPVGAQQILTSKEASAKAVNRLVEGKAVTLLRPFVENFKNFKFKKVGIKKLNKFNDFWAMLYTESQEGSFTLDRESNFRTQFLEQLQREDINIYDPHELLKVTQGYTIDELLEIYNDDPDKDEWIVSDQDVTETKHPLTDFINNLLKNDLRKQKADSIKNLNENFVKIIGGN